MLKQIKDLCLFMVCGQTLLYFQSGKKYEKICRMILELLVLAGIVGMILNLLQSLGIQRGEMEAAGGAVAGMQRSMEEALSRQLGVEGIEEDFLSADMFDSLVEQHTMEEIKMRYNYFAQQYGLEIQRVEKQGETLMVFLRETDVKESADTGQGEEVGEEQRELQEETEAAESSVKIAEIEQIEIGKIEPEKEEEEKNTESEEESSSKKRIEQEKLEDFRRQLALVLAMEEEKLEVILIG